MLRDIVSRNIRAPRVFWHGEYSVGTSGALCWAVYACSPAALRVQEDNQEELQRVLGVEFAKDDEEEEEEHAGVSRPSAVLLNGPRLVHRLP